MKNTSRTISGGVGEVSVLYVLIKDSFDFVVFLGDCLVSGTVNQFFPPLNWRHIGLYGTGTEEVSTSECPEVTLFGRRDVEFQKLPD